MTNTRLKVKDEVIQEIQNKYTDCIIDFSKFEYVNSKTLATVVCPIHGEVTRTPKDFLRSVSNHPCGPLDTAMFLNELKHIYGEEVYYKYDFSNTEYVSARHPTTVVCKTHGEIEVTPHGLISRESYTPCRLCNIAIKATEQSSTKDSFIEKAVAKYGDKCLDDFTDFVYITSKTRSVFRCKIHGDYTTTPNLYLTKSRCYKCK